jgi:TolA-binding protein
LLILAAAVAGAGVAAAGFGVASVWAPAAAIQERELQSIPAKTAEPAAARARAAAAHAGPGESVELALAPSASAPAFAFRAEAPLQAKPAVSSGSGVNLELARESELLQRALVKLRQQGDARGALALLDRYALEFPQGKLALEARVTRIDALLRNSERASALTLLEGLPFERLGRGDELRVLRAELRAERDCRHALPEFDALISQPLSAALAERSLYGRAACRLQLGDEAGGKADLSSYQERYPNGRFAERARARLGAR